MLSGAVLTNYDYTSQTLGLATEIMGITPKNGTLSNKWSKAGKDFFQQSDAISQNLDAINLKILSVSF